MTHESALLMFIIGLLTTSLCAYAIWGRENNFAAQLLDVSDFFAIIIVATGLVTLIVGLTFYFSPEEAPRDPAETRAHSYSLNKEARDENLERAQKALKKGDDGMARIWIEKAQESQDRMNNK